ncbi:hypothetical protein [Altererythrobacter sp. MF3-039]|uniref:hypothetical protein n=1 Tax=Altererythrobacter sp. MF3-039 TaxID=3252901 RepID=UPI00390C6F01
MTACSQSDWNERLSTPEDRSFALVVISTLRTGEIEGIERQIDAELYDQTLDMQDEARAALPKSGEPELVTVSSFSSTSADGVVSTKTLNYELGTNDNWAIIQIQMQDTDAGPLLIGWHVTPFDRRPTTANDFGFEGKGLLEYVWIVAMVLSTGTIIFAAVLAIRSKGIRHRWLWIIGCLIGFGKFQLNWSTAEWGFQPISFSILGSAALKPSPFDPWVMSFSLPIIALVFLVLRGRLLAANETETDQAGD